MSEYSQLFPITRSLRAWISSHKQQCGTSLSFHPPLVGPTREAGELGHAWSCFRVSPGLWDVTDMG